jgi:broad specificity phosphatase PhoE
LDYKPGDTREEVKDMLKVIFIRIAQTENNVIRKLSGRLVDSPLTEHGRAMAGYVADLLRNVAPTAVYSGPAPRCQETARYTTQQLGLPILVCEEFQEFDLGDFDGKNREEISKTEAGRIFLKDPSACEIPRAAESFAVSQQKAISKLG